MLRIAHIADVHVRNLSRHAEHRIVLEDLAYKVRASGVDHIFVGGDTFHTKCSGMSPECIDFMSWMFTTLAAAAPLHLTLGNHDGLLTNASRQDAITPIVTVLNNPRIHLYKKSGVYQFAPGYNWCVFSLFDEEGWKDVKPVPGNVNIACYHGPVYGAHTETDWVIEEGLTVDFFKDYDFVLLGDIHKHQYMGYRESELIILVEDLVKYSNAEVVEEIDA
jgi:hypothetical protein